MGHERVVIGYHGCDINVATQILAGQPFAASSNAYDWLGHGVYFWEYGPDRALKFAQVQVGRGRVSRPAYVGAELRLGRCFDLLDTRFTGDLAAYYLVWKKRLRARGLALPQNAGKAPYFMKRDLDCAVINSYLDALAAVGTPYDTVRGCFLEGRRVFPRSGIYREAHVQVAVRTRACITRVFDPTLESP